MGLFDDIPEENNGDIDFGELFKPKKKKEKPKKKKRKEVKEDISDFGLPVEALFTTAPVEEIEQEKPQFDFSPSTPPKTSKNIQFRKDIPKDVIDCIMNCLCDNCKQKVVEIQQPTSKPIPQFRPEMEEKVTQMFEDDEEEEFEDDLEDDDFEEEEDEDEEDLPFVTKKESQKSQKAVEEFYEEQGFFQDDEEEEEEDFFSSLKKQKKPFDRGGFKF